MFILYVYYYILLCTISDSKLHCVMQCLVTGCVTYLVYYTYMCIYINKLLFIYMSWYCYSTTWMSGSVPSVNKGSSNNDNCLYILVYTYYLGTYFKDSI